MAGWCVGWNFRFPLVLSIYWFYIVPTPTGYYQPPRLLLVSSECRFTKQNRKMQGVYLNTYSELNAYIPKCSNFDHERTAAATLRESYKQKRNEELVKIDELKQRHQYLVGQIATLQ